jgi:hypothetical protein
MRQIVTKALRKDAVDRLLKIWLPITNRENDTDRGNLS